jgi:hypothetical protein
VLFAITAGHSCPFCSFSKQVSLLQRINSIKKNILKIKKLYVFYLINTNQAQNTNGIEEGSSLILIKNIHYK